MSLCERPCIAHVFQPIVFVAFVFQALADALLKGRHYVFPNEQGKDMLDPRLLLVEFNSSILLHKSQVRCYLIHCSSGVHHLLPALIHFLSIQWL